MHFPFFSHADINFIRTSTKSWYDPNNWCMSADPEGDCSAAQPDVLHSERLPCRHDVTTFPEDSTFLVDLDTGIDIYMDGLYLGGKVS